MSFTGSTQLNLLSDGIGGLPRLWTYVSTDTSATATSTGYFKGMGRSLSGAISVTKACAGLMIGDLILCIESTASGGTIGRVTQHMVVNSTLNSTVPATVNQTTAAYDCSISSTP